MENFAKKASKVRESGLRVCRAWEKLVVFCVDGLFFTMGGEGKSLLQAKGMKPGKTGY